MDTINEYMVSILTDEDFTSIYTKEDMDTEAYIRLQNELNQMRKLKTVRYLYTAGRNAEGTLVYREVLLYVFLCYCRRLEFQLRQ